MGEDHELTLEHQKQVVKRIVDPSNGHRYLFVSSFNFSRFNSSNSRAAARTSSGNAGVRLPALSTWHISMSGMHSSQLRRCISAVLIRISTTSISCLLFRAAIHHHRYRNGNTLLGLSSEGFEPTLNRPSTYCHYQLGYDDVSTAAQALNPPQAAV